ALACTGQQPGGGEPQLSDCRGRNRHAITPCVRARVAKRVYAVFPPVHNRVQSCPRPAATPAPSCSAMGHRVLSWSVWPLGMSLQASIIGIAGWSDPNSVGRAMGLTTIAFLFLLLGLEQVLPYREDWSTRGDREIWRDLGHAVLYTSIGGNLAQITFLSGVPWVLSQLGAAGGLGIWPVGSPLLVQVLAVVLLGDLLEYWYHRLVHTNSRLWPLHAVHHTPTRLNVLKGPRHHVAYFLGRGVLVWTPLMVIGVPPRLVVWQFAAEVLVGTWAHANLAFQIPAFVHRI